MQLLVKIIVEQIGGQWSAWIEWAPQIAIGGEYPSEAIHALIAHVGEWRFHPEEIQDIQDAAREGHLEFMVPLRGVRRIPVPSVN